MAVTQEKFSSLLKGYLREKKVRQQTVASELGLTSSAVSQMLAGNKMLFKMSQLNHVCEMLALKPEQTFELQALLLKMRNAGEYAATPFARMLFALRSARGVSYRELANLTGIPSSTLEALEKDDSTSLTPEIAAKLAPVLNCRAQLLLSAADVTMNTSFYAFPDIYAPLAAAEPGPTFSSSPAIPELPLEALRAFTPGEDLNRFLIRHASRHVTVPGPVGIAVVRGSFREFGMAGELPLCILLAENNTSPAGIELVFTDRGFSLITPAPRKHILQLFTGTAVRYLHLHWRLPVVSVVTAVPVQSSTKEAAK